MTKKTPHPVDAHVGLRIRQQRTLMGISQTVLGNGVGITFQQVQKYENGSNRCSASMLWHFAQLLGVEPGHFFEGLRVDGEPKKPTLHNGQDDPFARRETLELVRDYYSIGKPGQRNAVRDLVRSMGQAA